MKLKCGCQQQECVDERSRFVLCVCERKIEELGVIVFAHVTSLCVDEYACVCSCRKGRPRSAETDHPMMGYHWKIGLILHTYLSMEMSYMKN